MARLSAAQKKRRRKPKKQVPDFIASHEGKIEIVAATADNPFAYGHGNTHQKERVLKNQRTSPITYYYNSKLIQEHQHQAGLQFEGLYYRSKATPSAQDFTKEPVDGGGGGDVFQDVTIDAIKELITTHAAIGREGYQLLEQICGHHVYVRDLARNSTESKIYMNNLREALDAAGVHWGLIKPNTKRFD